MIATTLALAIALVGCTDPVAAERRESLGPEAPGVHPGPTHRPGQPCVWCHDGTDQREFSLAGTIYAKLDGQMPVSGARVVMTDATGATFTAETNCAGNFFVRAESWKPTFPVQATVKWRDQSQEMESPIHREASCGACHGQTTSPTSAGPIFLWSTEGKAPPGDLTGGCK